MNTNTTPGMSKRELAHAWGRMFATALWLTVVGWVVGAALGFMFLGAVTWWHAAN